MLVKGPQGVMKPLRRADYATDQQFYAAMCQLKNPTFQASPYPSRLLWDKLKRDVQK
jgi:hypothetical protein